MIRILDEQFKKTVRGGALVLDRAAVITLAVSVRADLPTTPMIRCDLAYGSESGPEFEPWDYNNPQTTLPIFIEGPARCKEFMGQPCDVKAKTMGELVMAVLHGAEEFIISRQLAGPSAQLDRTKPAAIAKAEVKE